MSEIFIFTHIVATNASKHNVVLCQSAGTCVSEKPLSDILIERIGTALHLTDEPRTSHCGVQIPVGSLIDVVKYGSFEGPGHLFFDHIKLSFEIHQTYVK